MDRLTGRQALLLMPCHAKTVTLFLGIIFSSWRGSRWGRSKKVPCSLWSQNTPSSVSRSHRSCCRLNSRVERPVCSECCRSRSRVVLTVAATSRSLRCDTRRCVAGRS